MAGEPTQGDGKPLEDAIGMLAFNEPQPANDEFGPSEAMLVGWCFVSHDQHADIWDQVSLNNHASCDITVSVGPITFNTMDWSWDVKKNLRIEDVAVAFSRRKVEPPKEEKPAKRGMFG